jgi:hypothetical protein
VAVGLQLLLSQRVDTSSQCAVAARHALAGAVQGTCAWLASVMGCCGGVGCRGFRAVALAPFVAGRAERRLQYANMLTTLYSEPLLRPALSAT